MVLSHESSLCLFNIERDMRNIKYFLLLKAWLVLFLVSFLSCSNSDDSLPDGETEDKKEQKVIEPVADLMAKETTKANELEVTWKSPAGVVLVEISYWLYDSDEADAVKNNVRVNGEIKKSYLLSVPEYGTYQISAVSIDNYGRRSKKVIVTATPAEEDAPLVYEILEDKLPIADPYILYQNGKYYAYGTHADGFEVYISDDLQHWRKNPVLALEPKNSWGTRWYWAPEVYYVKSRNRFYMFYSVDEHICVASANTPEGPFVQSVKKPIVEDEKGIDTSLFIDDDGTPYLYYVRFTSGNVIWVAEMNTDLQSIKKETLTKCITADASWEKKQGTIAEGPSIIKKGDTYYLIYSANHYESQDYAVGYATASSPKGPWKKYSGNPILRRDKEAASSVGLVGTGHGAPFVCADGTYKYIFHAHASSTSIGPRTSYISNFKMSDDGVISITGETIKPVVVK